MPFSGSVVQYIFRSFDGFIIYGVKVSAFREILSDKSIQIFVCTPFPAMQEFSLKINLWNKL